jgi:hypothetical protein
LFEVGRVVHLSSSCNLHASKYESKKRSAMLRLRRLRVSRTLRILMAAGGTGAKEPKGPASWRGEWVRS